MSQHANAFRVVRPQKVAEVIEPGIGPGIEHAGRAKMPVGAPPQSGRADQVGNVPRNPRKTQEECPIKPNVLGAPLPPLLSGKALKDWIQDKGFDGVSTKRQGDGPKGGAKAPGAGH